MNMIPSFQYFKTIKKLKIFINNYHKKLQIIMKYKINRKKKKYKMNIINMYLIVKNIYKC